MTTGLLVLALVLAGCSGERPRHGASGDGLLLVRADEQLPPGIDEQVAAREDVQAVATVRSGQTGLVGARRRDGAPVITLGDGFRLPIAVAVADPPALADAIGSEQGEHVERLEPGRVLVSETSAAVHDLTVADEVQLVGAPPLRIADVVPDGLVGTAELVLHEQDAAAAGLEQPDETLYVRHAGAARDVERGLRSRVTEETRARIIDGDTPQERYESSVVLPLAEVKQRFGAFAYRPLEGERAIEIEPGFVDEHMVEADVPILGTVFCHRGIIEPLRAALAEVVSIGAADEIDPAKFGGCFAPRRVGAEEADLSRHAWGIAVDINVDLSLPGLGPVPPDEVIAAFERHGFRWGGDFLQPDNHHFEWAGPFAPETG
jgi:hypothetical protein